MDFELPHAFDAEARRTAGKRAQAREQTRRLILGAARRIFAKVGYGQATVRDIVRATPLASGTFYNYFRSKEEVFHALRDEAAQALRPALREARLEAATAEEFAAATFRTFFSHVAANRGDLVSIRPGSGLHVRVDTPEILAGFEELKEDFQTAIAHGLFPPCDAEFLTAALIGIAFEMAEVMQRREFPDAEGAARFATALFMGGVAKTPKQGNGHTPAAH